MKDEEYVTKLSKANEATLLNYIMFLQEQEAINKHYLGPHFCYKHHGIGYTLHVTQDIGKGHFFLYQAHCRFEGDRRASINEGDSDEPDDLFHLVSHATDNDSWSVVLDCKETCNFARYVGGTSPTRLDDANCMAFTVAVDGFYQILIVVVKDCKAGDALQYYYRGLKGESKYRKIPPVTPMSPI